MIDIKRYDTYNNNNNNNRFFGYLLRDIKKKKTYGLTACVYVYDINLFNILRE